MNVVVIYMINKQHFIIALQNFFKQNKDMKASIFTQICFDRTCNCNIYFDKQSRHMEWFVVQRNAYIRDHQRIARRLSFTIYMYLSIKKKAYFIRIEFSKRTIYVPLLIVATKNQENFTPVPFIIITFLFRYRLPLIK